MPSRSSTARTVSTSILLRPAISASSRTDRNNASASRGAPRDAFASAQAEAERALALDPDLADGHRARAAIRFWSDRDHESAESGTRRAIELDPGDAEAQLLLGVMLGWRGAGGEARDVAARARHLDADCPLMSGCEAYVSYLTRQFEDAVAACDRALEMDPDSPIAIWVRATVDLAQSQPQKVVGDLEEVIARCGRATSWLGLLGRAYAESGRSAQARVVLDDLRARSNRQYVAPAYLAASIAKQFNSKINYISHNDNSFTLEVLI